MVIIDVHETLFFERLLAEILFIHKLIEIFKAIHFERQYDKETIMEWYLNTIYFGYGKKPSQEIGKDGTDGETERSSASYLPVFLCRSGREDGVVGK